MAAESPANVTEVMSAARAGRPGAADQLMELVYDELRRLARHQMAHVPPGATLQPTALVHEAYLRLVGKQAQPEWESRAHFFNCAARAMRDLLVEKARSKASLKRGGGRLRITLDEQGSVSNAGGHEDLLDLTDALEALEATDPVSAQIAMLRYFSGLTVEQIAEATSMSTATVKRRWRYALAWLHRYICDGRPPGADQPDDR